MNVTSVIIVFIPYVLLCIYARTEWVELECLCSCIFDLAFNCVYMCYVCILCFRIP